MIFWIVFSIW